jgi:hypothetical protein
VAADAANNAAAAGDCVHTRVRTEGEGSWQHARGARQEKWFNARKGQVWQAE